jgi:excisionase family DNA binding protein
VISHAPADHDVKPAAESLLRALIDAAPSLGITLSPPRLLLSCEEAADLLAISPRFLAALAVAGDVPSRCVGARRLFQPEALREWVAAGCPHPSWSEQAQAKRQAAATDKPAKKRPKMTT